MCRLVVFWIRPAWSSLEQGKKLQHFLLDRLAKCTSFVSWTGSGFRWVGRTPLPKFLLITPPPLPPSPRPGGAYSQIPQLLRHTFLTKFLWQAPGRKALNKQSSYLSRQSTEKNKVRWSYSTVWLLWTLSELIKFFFQGIKCYFFRVRSCFNMRRIGS